MTAIQFNLINKNLFLTQHQRKSKISFLNANTTFEVESMAFFYTYNREMIIENLFDEYLKNPNIPMIYLSSYDHVLMEKMRNKTNQENLGLNLAYSNRSINNEEFIFNDKFDEKTQKMVVNNCEKNQLTIFSNTLPLDKCTDEMVEKYKNLFFSYLEGLKKLINRITKTIFIVHIEHGIFNKEELGKIHQTIKSIKESKHICIFAYKSYDDVRDDNMPLFGDDNLYNHYFISTMGYGNNDLINTKDSKIYQSLPIQLKDFFADIDLKEYLNNQNFFHKKHKISVINDSFRKSIKII